MAYFNFLFYMQDYLCTKVYYSDKITIQNTMLQLFLLLLDDSLSSPSACHVED